MPYGTKSYKGKTKPKKSKMGMSKISPRKKMAMGKSRRKNKTYS